MGLATIIILPLCIMAYNAISNQVPPTQELRQIMNEVSQTASTLNEQSQSLESNTRYREFVAKRGFSGIFLEQSLQVLLLSVMVLFFWFKTQSTPGKLLLSMKIVDNKTMNKPTLFQYIRRLFGYIISMLPFGLGLFYIAFNKKHRALHDLVAGTVVVSTKLNHGSESNK